MNGEATVLHRIASWGPWLAPLPSAWFVGRSIYLHLLLRWGQGEVTVHPIIHIGVAFVAGLTIEILGIVSVYSALAMHRWNDLGNVQKDRGSWESAPFGLAVICALLYLVAAVCLLVVLEAVPEASQFAPAIFPFMGIVAAVNLGILDQHMSRLQRYGLTWHLTKRKTTDEEKEEKPKPPREASIEDIRAIAAKLNGDHRRIYRRDLERLLQEEGLKAPSVRSAQGWAKDIRDGRL